jgi:hypothetical protein
MMITLLQIFLLIIRAMIHVLLDDSLLIDHQTVVMAAASLVDDLLIDGGPVKRNFLDDGVKNHSDGKTIFSQPGTKVFQRH